VPSLAGECYSGFGKQLVEQMPPVGGDDQEKSDGRYEHPRDNHPEADAPERAVTLALDEPPERNPDAGDQKEQERATSATVTLVLCEKARKGCIQLTLLCRDDRPDKCSASCRRVRRTCSELRGRSLGKGQVLHHVVEVGDCFGAAGCREDEHPLPVVLDHYYDPSGLSLRSD
jgi:hypothetical protein